MGVAITAANPLVGGDRNIWGTEQNEFNDEVRAAFANLSKADVGLDQVPDVDATDRANQHGSQTASTISDLTEAVQDLIGTFLAAGAGIALNYDDTANTLTISAATVLSPVFCKWNGSAYPARSTVTTNPAQPVIWVGPVGTKPNSGGLYAITEVDFFWGY